MDQTRRYFNTGPRVFNETTAAWIVAVLVVVDAVFLGTVAWNSYMVSRESRETFEKLARLAGETCQQPEEAAARYGHDGWKFSFELPPGIMAVEQKSDDDGVEIMIAERPAADVAAPPHTLYDTSVRVHVGKAAGFGKYLAKPTTTYAGYRRFTAIGRTAVTFADPNRELEAIQVILIDDARSDREVRITYSVLRENAEPIALDILKSFRLAAREKQEIIVKPGWKIFSQDPLRLQYPEDYRVSLPFPGKIVVTGKGGRLEIVSAYDIDDTASRRKLLAGPSTDSGVPDEYFDLQYGVALRVAFYYAADATEYDKSILKEIASTVTLAQ